MFVAGTRRRFRPRCERGAVNLTATDTQADGYLTTWPTGEPRPNASSLNFAAGPNCPTWCRPKVGANGSDLDLEQQRQPRHAQHRHHRRHRRILLPSAAAIGALSRRASSIPARRPSSAREPPSTCPLSAERGSPIVVWGGDLQPDRHRHGCRRIPHHVAAGEPATGASSAQPSPPGRRAPLVVAKVGGQRIDLDLEQQGQPRHATDARSSSTVVGLLPAGAGLGHWTPRANPRYAQRSVRWRGPTAELQVVNRGGVPATGVGAVSST